LDGVRYLLIAHKFMTNREPYQVFHARRIEYAESLHPEGMSATTRFFVEQKIATDYSGNQQDKPMLLPRASSRRGKTFDRAEWAKQRGINY
jgi:hypothetical protein